MNSSCVHRLFILSVLIGNKKVPKLERSGTFHHKTRVFIGLFGGKLSENTVSAESKIIFDTF